MRFVRLCSILLINPNFLKCMKSILVLRSCLNKSVNELMMYVLGVNNFISSIKSLTNSSEHMRWVHFVKFVLIAKGSFPYRLTGARTKGPESLKFILTPVIHVIAVLSN